MSGPCACNMWATDLRVGYPSGHHPKCEHQPDRKLAELAERHGLQYIAEHHEPMKLLRRLLDQHQIVMRPDPFATAEQYLVRCPVCDGNRWHVWCPGDPIRECQFIRDARDLNLL